jgi:hypothetical protein
MVFLDLGTTPLANAFIRPERLAESEARFPLQAMRCVSCGLAQLTVVVRPELMFSEYLYTSSASAPLRDHFSAYADEVMARFAGAGSLVVEIGSNDGLLLGLLASRGARVLGVEPAGNLATAANAAGRETWPGFFSAAIAHRAVLAKGRATAVLGNNVFAHIDDLIGTLTGVELLLDEDGVFIFEVPYLADLLEHVEYDTIYHEHLSYFHLAPLRVLFARAGMEVFDAQRLGIHGGSVRVYAARAGRHAATSRLATLLGDEDRAGLERASTFAAFADRVAASKEALRAMLGSLRAAGKRLAAIGATAKGNTLLNYCAVGPDTVGFIGDSTPLKQGLLTPGMHIPVVAEAEVTRRRPDYTLLLAWNYAGAIVRKHAAYTAAGGRFIHPIPLARIYEAT